MQTVCKRTNEEGEMVGRNGFKECQNWEGNLPSTTVWRTAPPKTDYGHVLKSSHRTPTIFFYFSEFACLVHILATHVDRRRDLLNSAKELCHEQLEQRVTRDALCLKRQHSFLMSAILFRLRCSVE